MTQETKFAGNLTFQDIGKKIIVYPRSYADGALGHTGGSIIHILRYIRHSGGYGLQMRVGIGHYSDDLRYIEPDREVEVIG